MDNQFPIRISIVSYLNSKPFINGLKKVKFNLPVEISEDIPSICAEKLLGGKADIGLIPVSILSRLKNYSIISDYCIGADGAVNSVLLLSEVPLKEIKTILLDYQSRTSVLLARVLAKKFWNINPKWEETSSDYEKNINANKAGVVIGDRALLMKKKFPYVYDLSAEWKLFTGLPFVFACWVSLLDLEKDFLYDFNNALKNGLSSIKEIAKKECSSEISEEEISNYLTQSIDYNLNEPKMKALQLFLEMAKEVN